MAVTLKTSTGFGGMVTDGNRVAMVVVGNWPQTSDATDTPKTSPLTVSNSTVTLTVPERAVQLVLAPTSNDVRVSELSDVSTYYVVKANITSTIDCARLGSIYLLRDGGADATVQFYFNII